MLREVAVPKEEVVVKQEVVEETTGRIETKTMEDSTINGKESAGSEILQSKLEVTGQSLKNWARINLIKPIQFKLP